MCQALKRSISIGACPSSNVAFPSTVAGTKNVVLAVPYLAWDSGSPSSPGVVDSSSPLFKGESATSCVEARKAGEKERRKDGEDGRKEGPG